MSSSSNTPPSSTPSLALSLSLASAPSSPLFDVYVMDISYFSGKFEAYLRYKEIPYRRIRVEHRHLMELFSKTGTMKVPAIRLQDGRWLKDSSAMIDWAEKEFPATSVFPEPPALLFLARLLEDYADEWLWRPAMWWRWEPIVSRKTLARRIAQEILADFPAPDLVLRPYFAWRQRREWLWNDGMDRSNAEQVKQMYLTQLEALQAILSKQPYLLGSHPSLADFGYMGPFFRHFSHDPDPAEVMRQRGPAVYEWTARMWNAKASLHTEAPVWIWPEDDAWKPIWVDLCQAYLPYLHQNAVAWRSQRSRFDFQAGGYVFRKTKTTAYRVWCRQNLQRAWAALSEADQATVRDFFGSYGGIDALFTEGTIDAGLDEDLRLPFAERPAPPWWVRAFVWGYGKPR